MRWGRGIQAIVGESFAEIFFGNCVALGIPCVTVSAEAIAAADGAVRDASPSSSFRPRPAGVGASRRATRATRSLIPDGAHRQLVEGSWDTTGELLAARDDIARTANALPYFSGWRPGT